MNWEGLFKRRVVSAGRNSIEGLKACFRHEEAFRIEVVVGGILSVVAILIAESYIQWALLVAPILLVLIVELLNSAVEATVDLVREDYHDLAKRAKDIGSAAVLVSFALFFIVWGAVIFSSHR
ncbi:MAG: diacylglycerol kinase [bacterium]